LPAWVTSLAGVGAELRSGARAVGNLAINGMEAIVDLWQAPQQFTDDINQGRPRKEPSNIREGVPLLRRVPTPHGKKPAARNNDVNRADARGNPFMTALVEEPFVEFSVGDWIEVFSNSYQVWCAAQVKSINSKVPTQKMVTVAFRPPGAAHDEILNKTLPLDSKELRKVRHSHQR